MIIKTFLTIRKFLHKIILVKDHIGLSPVVVMIIIIIIVVVVINIQKNT